MKESELAWVGPIPPQWHRQPLKTLFHQHKEKNTGVVETNLLSLSYGRIVRRDINQRGGLLPESFESYNIVSDGDIVLRLTDLQNDQKSLRTGLVREKGIITSAYIILRANYSVNTDYFQALLESYDYKKVFYSMGGGVRQGLNYDDISSLSLLVPPASEQCSIAEFIYYKRTEIDWLIEKLRRQVELLERYRRELIAHTVTHGLNPDAPMRDSGIDWIGDMPGHWHLVPMLAIFSLIRDLNASNESSNALQFQEGKIVRKTEVHTSYSADEETLSRYTLVQSGDIVINGLNLNYDFRTKRVAIVEEEGVITSAYIAVRPKMTLWPEWVNYLLKAFDSMKIFHGLTEGVRKILSWKDLRRFTLLVPPFSEQQEIAEFLDARTSEIDSTISNINKQIELLGKYRKQVINDAVTGKVRVEGTE